MITYFECGECGKQSCFEVNGLVKCPHCGATKCKRALMGGNKPEWYHDDDRREREV